MKKATALMLVFVMSLTIGNEVNASQGVNMDYSGKELYCDVDKNKLSTELKTAVKNIKERGYSDEIISDLSLDTIWEIGEIIEQDPTSVEITKNICTFDEMKNIELVVNLSVTDLVEKCGMDRNIAKQMKEQINKMSNMSDIDLKKNFNMTNADIVILKQVLRKQNNYEPYKNIDETDKVTLSSSISTSKLSFTQTVTNKSTYRTKNGKKVRTNSKYKVNESFNWKKCYYPWGYNDTIAVAWSGGYAYKTNSKKVNYYNMKGILPAFTWAKTQKGTKNATASGSASKGCKYSFSQAYSSSMSNIAYAKSGKIELTLSQNGYKGKKAQIISKYCHKVFTLGSVSISSSPSISAGASYDTTDTDETTTTIYY